MKIARRCLVPCVLLMMILGWRGLSNASPPSVAHAQGVRAIPRPAPPVDDQTGEAVRKTTLDVHYTAYEWWLIRWKRNKVTCRITIDHDGLPKSQEILDDCGANIHEDWYDTPTCSQVDVSQCEGVYLQYIRSYADQKRVEIELPIPKVWISLPDCIPTSIGFVCEKTPMLRLQGEEPLPNESIIRIQGVINAEAFSCAGSDCSYPLPSTGNQGGTIQFQGVSSYGDQTETYTAKVRVIPWGDFSAPEGQGTDKAKWYVDIISGQLRDGSLASCTDVWQVFPDVGGPDKWLTTPDTIEGLQTSESFYYLAGILIANGEVDASTCPEKGLYAPYIANACGVDVAQLQIIQWQNLFDTKILEEARRTGVPATLMKNLFTRESQFWPGIYKSYQEAGLGALTENGADAVFAWNQDFYDQFCPLVFYETVCNKGYFFLTADQKQMLRGALVRKVESSCPDCPLGIDLSQANFSVRVFAETIRANCQQVGRLITNTTERSPGSVASFEDLWRFTLVNYNAGPGCLTTAIGKAWQAKALDWEHVSSNLDPVCQEAKDYVEDIANAQNLPLVPTPGGYATPFPTLGMIPTWNPASSEIPPSPPPPQETGTPLPPPPPPPPPA